MTVTKPTSPQDALARMREPFLPNQISKLPKPYKKDSPKGNCKECGGYHGLPAVHLDYVGHAALTDRLLDVDPLWSWEPVADPVSCGLPVAPGGMWIRLNVCGMSRYGFGHPDGKTGGDAVKETIGDALRNAAMRFGAALDLWHKGDLHVSTSEADDEPRGEPRNVTPPKDSAKVEPKAAVKSSEPTTLDDWADKLAEQLRARAGDRDDLRRTYDSAARLCADLDAQLPERLVEINALYAELIDAAEEVFS